MINIRHARGEKTINSFSGCRYESEDDVGTSAARGADLAELLLRAEPYDAAYHYRSRVHLSEEYGLPPDGKGEEPYQVSVCSVRSSLVFFMF
jgi:hypothetical protein